MPPRPAPARRRSVHRPAKKPPEATDATYALYDRPAEGVASAVTDEERAFFFEWTAKRHIPKEYVVLALTYWMRVRSRLWTHFLLHPKEVYMILCVHIALKWLGYDEVLKCNFIQDLREVASITMDTHQRIEYLVLSELGWDL
ncbi:unnamed protein product [Ectocarpus sp. 12 AP-2014]